MSELNWDDKIADEDRNANFFFSALKVLWRMMGQYRWGILASFAFLAINQGLNVTFPYLWKLIFDQIPQLLTGELKFYKLVIFIGGMFGLGFINTTFWHFVIQIRFARNLIKLENFWPVQAQKKLLSLSVGYHEKENTGKKISKIDKGCDKMVDSVSKLFWELAPQMFYLVINMIFVLVIDWRLGLIFFVPYVMIFYVGIKKWDSFVADWEQWEKYREESSGFFCQSIINVRTVQNFVQERREAARLQAVRSNMTTLDIGINRNTESFFWKFSTSLQLVFYSTILVGLWFVYQKEITIGSLIFLILTGNVIMSNIYGMINSYSAIIRRLVAVVRMEKLLQKKSDIENHVDGIVPNDYQGHLELDNVQFVYPGSEKPVIDNLTLQVPAGKMAALVGKSGEGKTTLIRLLARMYDVTDGVISLDGQDIRNYDLWWYRKLFAVVQQDVDVFDTTIRENIVYPYPDATVEEVQEAVKAAHLHIMIGDAERFPNGLETQVGERGVKLSGGERQRVGIARAYISLLHGAKILILDEATSNLDSEAERAIQNMINDIRKRLDISLIVIAHRLSTIKKADLIYVLNNGGVKESGNHEKLMNRNGLYASLVELQQLGQVK
ncbi:hypothetical protein COT97_02410 [Candidatus Falkowbacteria bacterium CG10_big_fil_rev_8_21_14_0_10_39_11]|uniref:ABC transporter ATP-binding protein n=1 Tax=Candidatus Falkowbacteria bacterium CG10_big_fil_rev_8_21_14_0_10_39_11 TaxID=1974565 RepID=A0A2H0V5C9_9BACT|nr:MAG: hypothetical protein COT97_02410 [Candidatus Falkowbacteria bacterium CG10_big_fil_rev_8_21_14_0_10_39_11]